MTFMEALKAVEKGAQVRRPGWPPNKKIDIAASGPGESRFSIVNTGAVVPLDFTRIGDESYPMDLDDTKAPDWRVIGKPPMELVYDADKDPNRN